jgi:putative 4-mercaptohistidine N1-methyltranferase
VNREPIVTANIYETEALLQQYLLFHYGTAEDQLPYPFGPHDALFYPVRCVSQFLPRIGSVLHALDLGCAVGGASFELSRWADSVVGIDLSQRFIETAQLIQQSGRIDIKILEEGSRFRSVTRYLDKELKRSNCRFQVGDALNLPSDFGSFELVLAVNLLDRVPDPVRLLAQLKRLVAPGGHLILASPYTWLEEFTPREKWLASPDRPSLNRIESHLEPELTLVETKDLPFLIREHARKFQWSVAQVSVWKRGA